MASTRSSPASEAWRALLIAFTRVHHALAEELDEAFGVPIEHYEILLMLYEAGAEGLRPSEIAARRRLSRSGATRLVDRLTEDGLVDRRECDDDRRGNVVSLTPEGRRWFTRLGRFHLDGIERHVGSRLNESESADLAGLLERLHVPGDHEGVVETCAVTR